MGISRARHQQGMAYLATMFAVFLIVLALSAAAVVWKIEVQRQNETELLFDGQQIAAALRSYSSRHASLYPTQLSQLLRDDQGLSLHRDLRRLYVDPLTDSSDWGLVRAPNGTIIAVYSRSTQKPIKNAHFPRGLEAFSAAKSYQDWVFRPLIEQPARKPGAPPASAAGPAAPASPRGRTLL